MTSEAASLVSLIDGRVGRCAALAVCASLCLLFSSLMLLPAARGAMGELANSLSPIGWLSIIAATFPHTEASSKSARCAVGIVLFFAALVLVMVWRLDIHNYHRRGQALSDACWWSNCGGAAVSLPAVFAAAAYSTGLCRKHWMLLRLAASFASIAHILVVLSMALAGAMEYPPGNRSAAAAGALGVAPLLAACVFTPATRMRLSELMRIAPLYALHLSDLQHSTQLVLSPHPEEVPHPASDMSSKGSLASSGDFAVGSWPQPAQRPHLAVTADPSPVLVTRSGKEELIAHHSRRLWSRIRQVFIGQKDEASPLSKLSHELVAEIAGHVVCAYLSELPQYVARAAPSGNFVRRFDTLPHKSTGVPPRWRPRRWNRRE